jgi:hypothetical protein
VRYAPTCVFQTGERNLLRVKIQSLFEDAKCFLFVEQAHGQKIVYLQDEAIDFLSQTGLTPFSTDKIVITSIHF